MSGTQVEPFLYAITVLETRAFLEGAAVRVRRGPSVRPQNHAVPLRCRRERAGARRDEQ